MEEKKPGAQSTATTAIGPTIVIKGKLKVDEDLIVKGRIEAEISSSKALFIENSGIVKANIKVKSVRISGVLVGNVVAEEKVEIAPDGRVVGDLLAPRIIISDGAAFRGRIDMQNIEEQAARKPEPAPAPKAIAVVPHNGDGASSAQYKQLP
jgi:cytoskeletal protein CcmA (bactofilin family)